MKHWQRERNYRKRINDDGTLSYIITVDGQDVEVSAEVYKTYAQGDRNERYQYERDDGLLLSLEKLAEDEMYLELMTNSHMESAEDTAVRNIMKSEMRKVLPLLDAD